VDAELQGYKQKMDSDLTIIKREILKYFGEDTVVAIALVGGWGRNEKTVVAVQDYGARVLSDYDVLVLLSQNVPDTRCMSLRHRLSAEVGVSVEIGAYTCQSISRFPPSVFAYELSQHKILWGRSDALQGCLPPVRAAEIPLLEGSRLLFNRGSALLLSLQHFLQNPDSMQARIDVLLSLAKMALALGDAWLIAEGKYHWSGQKRFEAVQNSTMSEDLKEWYGKAWKVKQGLEDVNVNGDIGNFCIKFLHICSDHHLSFERKRMKEEGLSWCQYALRELTIELRKPHNYIRLARMNLGLFGRPRGFGYPPLRSYVVSLERRLRGVLPLLLYARTNSAQVKQRLDLAYRLLNLPPELRAVSIEQQIAAGSERFGYIWRTFFS
jgi:predicted nucleotidyltransferase